MWVQLDSPLFNDSLLCLLFFVKIYDGLPQQALRTSSPFKPRNAKRHFKKIEQEQAPDQKDQRGS